KVLTPFLQPGGEIVENPRGNFLVVMDLPSNIQRLTEIADMIDVQVFAGTRMEIYQPKVASAEELSQEMIKVMQSFASSTPQTDTFTAQFIPLPRINQLLVISNSEAAWTYARRWLERIDVVAEGPGRRIFIYPVENGKAAELADVLSQALGQPSTGGKSSAPTLQDIHRSTAGGGTNPATGRSTTGSNFGSSSGSFGQQQGTSPGSAYAAVPVPGQVPAPGVGVPPQLTPPQAPGAVPRPPTPAAPAAQAQEQLRIVPDPATNSLIIYGTAQEFQNVKNILKDLDAIPRQVLIEAMVLQVDLGDTERLGVDYEFARGSRTIFGQKFPSSSALRSLGNALFPGAATPPALSAFGAGLSGIIGGKDVQAFFNVLATDSRVKVLSSPSVLAADNRPARIQVGTEEPVPTGTISQAVGGVAQSTSIQYRNTGRILTIIPQVNAQGLVNLQIKAEVSARGDAVQVGPDSFPSFNTQDAETTAVVHDGETLVIGGLIGERRSRGRNGIPYLMDIPVIGRFFGTTSDDNQRTELIMLITPRVIRTRAESVIVSDEFKAKLGAVRTELDRLAREREKMQLKPVPDQAPPMPVPPPASDSAPNATPTPLPPGRGASIAPLTDNAAAPASRAAAQLAVALPLPIAAPENQRQQLSQPIDPVEVRPMVAQKSQALAAIEPAYALSVVKQNVEMPKIPMAEPPKPAEAANFVPAKMWTVQVASVEVQQDAENLASQLRKSGYEAYVVTAQLETKTWHRVRVGQLKDLNAAMALRRDLISSKSFKTAYVATR
ncbi:MAG: ral secretion pathway protein, partial [Candidatus Binatota bacterium]|nr:ral secretion pathway protein [Candidatus Binatota bacterium]